MRFEKGKSGLPPSTLYSPRASATDRGGGDEPAKYILEGLLLLFPLRSPKMLIPITSASQPVPPSSLCLFPPLTPIDIRRLWGLPPSSSSSLFSRRVAGIEDMWRWLLFKETIWEMGKKTLFCLRAFPGAKKDYNVDDILERDEKSGSPYFPCENKKE